LHEGAARYRRIVETANEGIWTVDADGRTTFANPKMQQMLGVGADELLAHRWFDFMDDDGRAAMASEGLDHLKKGFSGQRELCLRRKDGSDLWATVSTSPIVDESGVYAGALAMVTDVTERKQAEIQRAQLEGQLRQSQKMEAIGTLAGGIAHDFNNIVAAILGNAALALQDLDKAHPAALRLEQIHQAGARGRSLVQQIVAFSRREPQQRVVQPLRPLIEDAAKLLRATMPTRVELELRLSDTPMQVSADGTQLQQVLMNLCTNAWHAMPSGSGRIAIGLEVTQLDAWAAERLGSFGPGRYAHLWVNDDGCGMDEATRLRIFEPFYTTKPVGQGSGLGLSVVHGIVTSHGGAITVDSAPDCGASFDIYLPLVALPGAAMPLPAAEPVVVQGQGQHVLYVDDDPVTATMIEALLQRAGYRVTCLADPREALSRAAALDDVVDVVVTDYNMPELSGLDLARQLHLTRPDLPVILSTGYVAATLRDDALRCGVRHVLQKEYSLEQLGALVQLALSERVEGAIREA
jgi:PAS domain S-box-containing protein